MEVQQRLLEEASRREQERLQKAAEQEKWRARGQDIADQDAEFEIGLLHDQVRDLQKESTNLRDKVEQLEESLKTCSQFRLHAEARLERYGENPRTRADAEKA